MRRFTPGPAILSILPRRFSSSWIPSSCVGSWALAAASASRKNSIGNRTRGHYSRPTIWRSKIHGGKRRYQRDSARAFCSDGSRKLRSAKPMLRLEEPGLLRMRAAGFQTLKDKRRGREKEEQHQHRRGSEIEFKAPLGYEGQPRGHTGARYPLLLVHASADPEHVPAQGPHKPDPRRQARQSPLGPQLQKVVMQMAVVTAYRRLPDRQVQRVVSLHIIGPHAEPGVCSHHVQPDMPHLKPNGECRIRRGMQSYLEPFSDEVR